MRKQGVCLLLLLVLQSSTTHYGPVLRHYFLQEELNNAYEGLWPSAKAGSKESTDALSKLAEVNKDIFWLSRAASLDHLDAQLALVKLSSDKEKLHWLKQAANNDHAASQFELSLLSTDKASRYHYLKLAAQNQYAPAVISLANLYYEAHDMLKAKSWLVKAAEFDPSSAFKLAKLMWSSGQKEESKQHFDRAADHSLTYAKYRDIANKKIYPLSVLSRLKLPLGDNCSQQLQFVATGLDSAVQAHRIKTSFEQDSRFDDFPICINEPLIIDKSDLHCSKEQNRTRCNLSTLSNKLFSPSFTHLVFFVDRSKAYTDHGVMYLDDADTYSVFVHELAHFSGFVDEYPVTRDLSQEYCRDSYAPNMLVLEEDENMKDHVNYKLWASYALALTQQKISLAEKDSEQVVELQNLDITRSRTCQLSGLKSFKPSSKITFLEYHDAHYIPEIYKMMWQDLLSQYHHEIAVARTFSKQTKQEEPKQYWQDLVRFGPQ